MIKPYVSKALQECPMSNKCELNNVKVHTTRSSGTIGKPNNVIVCGS
jgi:hypothetical protein